MMANEESLVKKNESTAALRIQSFWRGKKTRANISNQKMAVIRIQNLWRGVKCRRQYNIRKVESAQFEEEERDRVRRLRNIQEKQRELQLYRNLRADEVITYIEYRRKRAARIIQVSTFRNADSFCVCIRIHICTMFIHACV